jgi:dTDP-4-dehydrorhamnose 3,5-epimerase
MRFESTGLDGVLIVRPELRQDDRGWFARTWCEREARQHGLETAWVQCSMSYNARRGLIRGLHYQRPPYEETKLVRCTMGSIHDVVLDLRPDSPSFGRHLAVELSAMNRLAVYVPRGCAHGFQVLEDETEVFYQISEFYAPEHAAGVRWDDPAFAIPWPVMPPTMSDRDRTLPDYAGIAAGSARAV